MSLSGCLKKAGKNLREDDKAAVLALARQYRNDGMSANDAGLAAIGEHIKTVDSLITQAQAKPEAANDAAPASPTAQFTKRGDFFNYTGDRAKEIAKVIDMAVTKGRDGQPSVGLLQRMKNGGTEPQDTHYSGRPDIYNDLEALKEKLWTVKTDAASIATNVQHLLEASAQLTYSREPATRNFEVVDGQLRLRSGREGALSLANLEAAGQVDSTEILGVVLRPTATGVGAGTLRRAAISGSVARAIGKTLATDNLERQVGSGERAGVVALQAIRQVLGRPDLSASDGLRSTFYSRAEDQVAAAQSARLEAAAQLPRLANQAGAKALNKTLVNYGLGQDWRNAYEAVKLPDALSGVRQAIQTAFGRDVRAVAPTADKFNIFNGVYIASEPNAVYVNTAADVGFVNTAGHELWHVIEAQRPDLIQWYRQNSRQFYKDLPAYQDKLNALLQDGEKKYSREKAESELEADFMGDSLADPAFLQQLACARTLRRWGGSPGATRGHRKSYRPWHAALRTCTERLRGNL